MVTFQQKFASPSTLLPIKSTVSTLFRYIVKNVPRTPNASLLSTTPHLTKRNRLCRTQLMSNMEYERESCCSKLKWYMLKPEGVNRVICTKLIRNVVLYICYGFTNVSYCIQLYLLYTILR